MATLSPSWRGFFDCTGTEAPACVGWRCEVLVFLLLHDIVYVCVDLSCRYNEDSLSTIRCVNGLGRESPVLCAILPESSAGQRIMEL